MEEILVACGDVDLLRRIVGDLPKDRFQPIATKKGTGIAAKIAGRSVALAIVCDPLADGSSVTLRQELKTQSPEMKILVLGVKDADDFADAALSYPIPGPILRNAINRLAPEPTDGEDLDQWRSFYNELGEILERLPTQTYYEMFGLKTNVPHHVIVTIYDQISARYHPDRYAQHRGTRWGAAIYDRSNEIYKHMTEAFAVLTDRRMRKKYDSELTRGELRLSVSDSKSNDSGPETMDQWGRTPSGKKFLRLAQGDIAKKNLPGAIQNLKFAKSMEDHPSIDDKIAELEDLLKS